MVSLKDLNNAIS